MQNEFYTEQELSAKLRISLGTLRRWRLEGRGPRFRKMGSLVRYSLADLGQWMDEQPVGGTPLAAKPSHVFGPRPVRKAA